MVIHRLLESLLIVIDSYRIERFVETHLDKLSLLKLLKLQRKDLHKLLSLGRIDNLVELCRCEFNACRILHKQQSATLNIIVAPTKDTTPCVIRVSIASQASSSKLLRSPEMLQCFRCSCLARSLNRCVQNALLRISPLAKDLTAHF
jgi:hypothetical protein